MWDQLKNLKAIIDLSDDKQDLKKFGLSDEEIEGYEEFFFKEYFPKVEEE